MKWYDMREVQPAKAATEKRYLTYSKSWGIIEVLRWGRYLTSDFDYCFFDHHPRGDVSFWAELPPGPYEICKNCYVNFVDPDCKCCEQNEKVQEL